MIGCDPQRRIDCSVEGFAPVFGKTLTRRKLLDVEELVQHEIEIAAVYQSVLHDALSLEVAVLAWIWQEILTRSISVARCLPFPIPAPWPR
jgi:hypothetical protein